MEKKIKAAPTVVYPESDGKPMAETEYHRDIMIDFIQMLKHYFRNVNDVHVSGNLLMYYEEGNPRKSVSPDVFVAFGVSKKRRRTYKIWEEGHPRFCVGSCESKHIQAGSNAQKGPLCVGSRCPRVLYLRSVSRSQSLFPRIPSCRRYIQRDRNCEWTYAFGCFGFGIR